MGHISKQWLTRPSLRGFPYPMWEPDEPRGRPAFPVEIEVEARQAASEWRRALGVCATLDLDRGDRRYQELHLSEDEAIQAATTLIDCVSPAKLAECLVSSLNRIIGALSEANADALAETIRCRMSNRGRERLLLALLRSLSHAELLRVLAVTLQERSPLTDARPASAQDTV